MWVSRFLYRKIMIYCDYLFTMRQNITVSFRSMMEPYVTIPSRMLQESLVVLTTIAFFNYIFVDAILCCKDFVMVFRFFLGSTGTRFVLVR